MTPLYLILAILHHPQNPYWSGSFLNGGDEDQGRILELLLTQKELYFLFHGQDFDHRFTKVITNDATQRAEPQELTSQVFEHWSTALTGFEQAKTSFNDDFLSEHSPCLEVTQQIDKSRRSKYCLVCDSD